MATTVDFLQGFQAFLEGIALIASPCILPVLPIMLAGSLDGGRRRPLGIVTGFVGSFVGFALLSRQILVFFHADPALVRNTALVLLAALGGIMLSKKLSDLLFRATEGLANFGQILSSRWDETQGYWGGVFVGMLVGLIWTPCAGPILAAAVVQIIQAKSGVNVAITVAMFAVGAGVPMLLIALMGRQIMGRFGFLKTHAGLVRKLLGGVILISAVLIYLGVDVSLLASSEGAPNPSTSITAGPGLLMALDKPYVAQDFVGKGDWINSPPLKIMSLRGKVVLVDFWTYSCINCVRTLPHITSWDAKYHDKGLVIIGVHSPEFEFEKKLENVASAVKRYGIHYPVVLDNNLAIWGAFDNKYWPAHYLISKEGQVVYTHFGEGEYDQTEHNIRCLLGLDHAAVQSSPDNFPTFSMETPETYLGYARAKNFAGEDDLAQDEVAHYEFPEILLLNNWALKGDWNVGMQNSVSEKAKAALRLNFIAKKVFLVAGSRADKVVHAHIFLNGIPVEKAAGTDVKNSVLMINGERLYEVINQEKATNGVLELRFDEPGVKMYAFTFG